MGREGGADRDVPVVQQQEMEGSSEVAVGAWCRENQA